MQHLLLSKGKTSGRTKVKLCRVLGNNVERSKTCEQRMVTSAAMPIQLYQSELVSPESHTGRRHEAIACPDAGCV